MKETVLLIKVVHPIQYSNNFRKINLILDPENWHRMLKNAVFLTALNQKVLQGIKKSLEDVGLDAKIYWISTASL